MSSAAPECLSAWGLSALVSQTCSDRSVRFSWGLPGASDAPSPGGGAGAGAFNFAVGAAGGLHRGDGPGRCWSVALPPGKSGAVAVAGPCRACSSLSCCLSALASLMRPVFSCCCAITSRAAATAPHVDPKSENPYRTCNSPAAPRVLPCLFLLTRNSRTSWCGPGRERLTPWLTSSPTSSCVSSALRAPFGHDAVNSDWSRWTDGGTWGRLSGEGL